MTDPWDELERRDPWVRRADGRQDGPDWLALSVAFVCATGSIFLLAQLVRAVFGLSLGVAALAVVIAAGALVVFAVLVGSVINEGTK